MRDEWKTLEYWKKEKERSDKVIFEQSLFELWRKMDLVGYGRPYQVFNYGVLLDENWYYEINSLPLRQKEYRVLFWLAHELKVNFNDLAKLIVKLRAGNIFYKRIFISKGKSKKNGKRKARKIHIPHPELKRLQKKLGKWINELLSPTEFCFGFSGGSVENALKPHLRSNWLLSVDIKEAFPSVSRKYLIKALTLKKVYNFHRYLNYYERSKIFSWYSANIIADIAMFKNILPQGAPSSPKLFDLVCVDIDEKLSRLAARRNGVYTRYADNIYFSVPEKNFRKTLRNAIFRILRGNSDSFANFKYHKTKIVPLAGKTFKALGLNIIDRQLHNPRKFKRRLRLMIHHVRWLKENNMETEYYIALEKLDGMMQFAQKETLPKKLLEDYYRLKKEE